MDESLTKWEAWLEQSLKLDTGYQKIRVTVSMDMDEDVSVQRVGDTYEIEVYAPIRGQPERFKAAYDSVLRAIILRKKD